MLGNRSLDEVENGVRKILYNKHIIYIYIARNHFFIINTVKPLYKDQPIRSYVRQVVFI